MQRVLKLALEGEQIEVVEGMFVAMPLGTSEAVRGLSSESFGEAVQKAAKAVWERIAKLLAAMAAVVKGVAKWLIMRVKGDKGRKLNQEITHQYEVLEESIRNFASADPESKMGSIAKTDRLDEEYSRRLSATAHALLDKPDVYLGSVSEIEKLLDKDGQQCTIEASSMLVALAKLGPSHAFNQNEGERVNQEVAKVHEHFATLPEHLGIIDELIRSSYKNNGAQRLPAKPTAIADLLASMRGILSGTATVETFERWSKEIVMIEKDVDQAEKATQASLRVVKDDDDAARAQAMLSGYGAFWKEMEPVLKALSTLDQLRRGTLQLTDTVISYWKEIVKRTMDEYKDQETVLSRIVDLDKVFRIEASKLKQLAGL